MYVPGAFVHLSMHCARPRFGCRPSLAVRPSGSGRFGECQMAGSVNLETQMAGSVNLETLANVYQRVMKVLPDSIDSKTKRELVISSLVEASERGVRDENILIDSAITAVTRYQHSTVGRFVRG